MRPCSIADHCCAYGKKKTLPCKKMQKAVNPPLHKEAKGSKEDKRRKDAVYMRCEIHLKISPHPTLSPQGRGEGGGKFLFQNKIRQHPQSCKQECASEKFRHAEYPHLCQTCFYQHKGNACNKELHGQ